VADAAVGCALYHHFGGARRFATVELKVNYFRPVTEGRLIARSRLVRIGSTICVGQVDLYDGHRRSVGLAIVTYMLLDSSNASPKTSPKAEVRPTGTSAKRSRRGGESR